MGISHFWTEDKKKKTISSVNQKENITQILQRKKIGEKEKKRKNYHKFFPREKRDLEKNGE